MDAISESRLEEIERRIVEAMVATFEVDCSGLVLDMTKTSPPTSIRRTPGPRSPNVDMRNRNEMTFDWSAWLVVSTDAGVPLVSHAYPGNKPDVTQFPTLVGELVSPLPGPSWREGGELTLVFDAGQNSNDNYKLLDGLPLHFVGSLPPSDHPELLSAAKDRYQILDEETFPDLRAFESRKVAFGTERRLVVCHSEGLHAKQSRASTRPWPRPTASSPRSKPASLVATPANQERSRSEIEGILAPRWLSRVISTTLDWNEPAELPSRVLHQRQTPEQLSKTNCSARGSCSPTTTTGAPKRSSRPTAPQRRSRADFSPDERREGRLFSRCSTGPSQKIRVHVLYCVVALMVARLMVREATGSAST